MKAAKEEKRRRFNFVSFRFSHGYPVARNIILDYLRTIVLSNQALKYISRFQWLIRPNSVWSCPVVSSCCLLRCVSSLAADTTRMRSPVDSAKQTRYPASSRVEKILSVWRVLLKWKLISPFRRAGFFFFLFFFAHASLHFLSWSSRSFCIYLSFIYIIYGFMFLKS